jgi:hypothetical protein
MFASDPVAGLSVAFESLGQARAHSAFLHEPMMFELDECLADQGDAHSQLLREPTFDDLIARGEGSRKDRFFDSQHDLILTLRPVESASTYVLSLPSRILPRSRRSPHPFRNKCWHIITRSPIFEPVDALDHATKLRMSEEFVIAACLI